MAPGILISRRLGTAAVAVTVLFTPLAFPAPAHGLSNGECAETTLVLDESGSIDPHEATVRSAVSGFLNPLVDSGVSASIVEFGTSAKTVFGYTPITATNIANVFDPYLQATSSGDVYNSPSQTGPFTNWDDALDESHNSIRHRASPRWCFS